MGLPPQVDEAVVIAPPTREHPGVSNALWSSRQTGSARARQFGWLAIGVLLFIGHLPLLVKYAADVWQRPEYHFVPVVLTAAAYLAWERVREQRAEGMARGSGVVAGVMLAAAWVCLAAGALLWLRILAAAAAWLTLAAVAWEWGGRRLARALLPIGLLVLTTIPPPMRREHALTGGLRRVAVWASSGVLDWLGVPHVLSGSVIDVPGKRLLIEQACSGIHSFIAIVVFTLLLGILWRRRAAALALLLVAASVFVMAMNVVRIAAGAWLIHRWHVDTFGGAAHELIGWALFVVCLGLVASMDRFLLLCAQWRWRGDDEPAATAVVGGVRGEARAAMWPWAAAAIAFAVTGVFSEMRVGQGWRAASVRAGAVFTMPGELAGWKRMQEPAKARPETIGRVSYVWYYRKGDLDVAVALDYPFEGYHDLPQCYAHSGWGMPEGMTHHDDVEGGKFSEGRMAKPQVAGGYLVYGLMDERGSWVGIGPDMDLWARLHSGGDRAAPAATYQLQVLMQTWDEPTMAQREELRRFFEACRAQVGPQVLAQLGGRGR